MKPACSRPFLTWTILVAASFFFTASLSRSSILYKSYVVKRDRGQDILCDPYIVEEKDAVFSMLSQKGELAQEDFTGFLDLFKRLNPHIRDLNRIRPGEQIFIPIRKLPPGTFYHQSEGIIIIPFVNISKVKKLIQGHSDTHRIKRGDCVSVLMARRFGAFGTESYRLGVDLFQRANPDISDLNRVLVGRKVYLPRASIPNETWFPSLLDLSGAVSEAEAAIALESDSMPANSGPPTERQTESRSTSLARAAEILNARIIRQGHFFFPSQGDSDLELDLSRFPVLETEDGKKVILSEKKIGDEVVYAVRSYWEDAQPLVLPEKDSFEGVMDALAQVIPEIRPHQNIRFSDGGLDVAIQSRWTITRPVSEQHPIRQTVVFLMQNHSLPLPEGLIRYLSKHGIAIQGIDTDNASKADLSSGLQNADTGRENPPPIIHIVHSSPRQVVQEIVSAFGYRYTPGVNISFPYGGLQVKARSDLITGKDGKMLLVDFGDLQGDAVKAIAETGIPVFQFKNDSDGKTGLRRLFNALDRRFNVNPTFQALKDRTGPNVSLTFPGFLILMEGGSSILITHDAIDADALAFLSANGIRVVTVPSEAGWL